MITNTQRILYNRGYYPAYRKNEKDKIEYNGYYYSPTFQEVTNNCVWKMELSNCCVSYFSDSYIKTSDFGFTHISKIRIGDKVLTYLAANAFQTYKHPEIIEKVVEALLGNASAAKYVKNLYKLNKLTDFKLLNNNLAFLSEFVCTLTKHLETTSFYHTYELLQELHLVLSLFGISSELRKTGNFWRLDYSYEDFLSKIENQGVYIVKPVKVLSIKKIKQQTQSFKVYTKSHQLVVNTVIVKGD